MLGYTYNDGGRKAAGYKDHGGQGDCVIRAIALISGQPYAVVRKAAREICGYKGWGTSKPDKLAKHFGLVKIKLGKGPRPTYTEAAAMHPDAVLSTAKHWTSVVGGVLHDTFDGREYEWEDECGDITVRERKAMSIWVKG